MVSRRHRPADGLFLGGASLNAAYHMHQHGVDAPGMLSQGRWLWEPGQPMQVADTVGAGDAFVASLVAHLLPGEMPDAEILSRACRLGEWVASQRGATPAYT